MLRGETIARCKDGDSSFHELVVQTSMNGRRSKQVSTALPARTSRSVLLPQSHGRATAALTCSQTMAGVSGGAFTLR